MADPQVNEILALLTGGQSPLDPRAGFLAQQFQAGTLPGDPTSNINTILDLLSPSASIDYAERVGGPQAIGRATGLPDPAIENVIRQGFGLQLSPAQKAAHQQALAAIVPQVMEQNTKRGELGVKQREVAVAESAEQRLRDTFEKGTLEERTKMYQENLKNIALTGKDFFGNDLGEEGKQRAFQILRGLEADPRLVALVTELGKAEEWEAAAHIAGVPVGVLKDTWLGPKVTPGGTEVTPGGTEVNPLERDQLTSGDPDVDAAMDEFTNGFGNLMLQMEKLNQQ